MKKTVKSFKDYRKWYRYQFFGSAHVTFPKEKIIIEANIANISFSGIGLYSPVPVPKGKRVDIKISFVNRDGKVSQDRAAGRVEWQAKFKKMFLLGITFEEELSSGSHPKLLEHLVWVIESQNLPQPFKDKRIAML